MKGTRPLDNNEIHRVSACFTGTFEARNRGLFMIGVSTGGRISELHRTMLLGSSLKKEADETLFLELALRGYELSRLREKMAGEIIKNYTAFLYFMSSKNPVNTRVYRTFFTFP